jgi:hypothetical protein
MPENRKSAIEIGQMNLRIPGEAESGIRSANDVVKSLEQKIPPGKQRRIGALNVRVQMPAIGTAAAMNDAIAEAIVHALWK